MYYSPHFTNPGFLSIFFFFNIIPAYLSPDHFCVSPVLPDALRTMDKFTPSFY